MERPEPYKPFLQLVKHEMDFEDLKEAYAKVPKEIEDIFIIIQVA